MRKRSSRAARRRAIEQRARKVAIEVPARFGKRFCLLDVLSEVYAAELDPARTPGPEKRLTRSEIDELERKRK